MASESESLRIVGGPSKLGLFLAFLDHKPDGETWREVYFSTKNSFGEQVDYAVAVQNVAFEDESGESWCIKGSVKGPANYSRRDVYGGYVIRVESGSSVKVEIYFSTLNRTGHLEVQPDRKRSCKEVMKDLLAAERALEAQSGRRSGYGHTQGFVPDEIEADIQQKTDSAREKIQELEVELARNHQ